MGSLFDRLKGERPPTTERALEQQRKGANIVARGVRETNARVFLLDALQNGPVPAAIIKELGTARGFNRAQLWNAKQQVRAGSFKAKGGKFNGCWYWVLTQQTPERATATKADDRHIQRLRDLSKTLGFRLRPIGKRPSTPVVRTTGKNGQRA